MSAQFGILLSLVFFPGIGLIVPNIVAMFQGDRVKGPLIDTALQGALFVHR